MPVTAPLGPTHFNFNAPPQSTPASGVRTPQRIETPAELLTRELAEGMYRNAVHFGAPFNRLDRAAIEELASEVVCRTTDPFGFGQLGVAGLLMDATCWTLVQNHLESQRRPVMEAPEAESLVTSDLQTAVHRAERITGDSDSADKRQTDFQARVQLRHSLKAMAETLSGLANADPGSCNLRGAVNIRGARARVAQIGIVGWGALIERKPKVVLPVFDGNNGQVAAKVTNRIALAAPHVQCINISGGTAPQDGRLFVDLSELSAGPLPEIEIRIKETLGLAEVHVIAPPHVAIRLERDGSTQFVEGDRVRREIGVMRVVRCVDCTPVHTQDLEFGIAAQPFVQ